MDVARLKSDLRRHEGTRLRPYVCTAGKITIGIGRNLTDNGISRNEAEYLLDNDIRRHYEMLVARFPVVSTLNDVRREVLVNMALNLGIAGVAKFVKMWAAIEQGDFGRAAQEMMDSRWSGQVGDRAVELAGRMKRGSPWMPW